MKALFDKYTYRFISQEEFQAIYQENQEAVFGGGLDIPMWSFLSEEEKTMARTLKKREGELYNLYMGVFDGEKLIAWHFGFQIDAQEFYMCNTGVLPEYQNKGIYSAFLPIIVAEIKKQGFQTITSKHKAGNNAVLVPKLKAGFNILGMELSPRFGTMIRLVYYVNPKWKEAYLVRTGERKYEG